MTEFRRIFKTKNTGKETLKELLLNLFISELLNPSPKVWIISPWVSDILLIDNTGGNFNSINPDWSGKKILLSDVIIQMLSMSSKIYVVSNLDTHNKIFFERIIGRAKEEGLSSGLTTISRADKHDKGIITNNGSLSGSMNITFNGLEINEEKIEYFVSREQIQEDLIWCERNIKGNLFYEG